MTDERASQNHDAKILAGLLLAWFLLNLLTAACSPVDPDEAYYWMYAQHLDWGYFDHPPAAALLIAIGKDWLPGALGLRFGHVLASAATIFATWHLLNRPRGKYLWLAAALVFAQPMLNVYGFIATPDGPLLLFTVLYLLAYRGFLRAPTLARGAIWGLTMVGLLYSKYHGVLLIFFSVLPNLGWLLRRPGAWLAALGGAALYLPHLYWQYANDFPSFRYHLTGRNRDYRLSFTLNYLLNQLLIFSPFFLWFYGKALARYEVVGTSAKARFVRANRWLVVGFAAFFLYMTKNGHPEAQWTALLAFPLIFLTYQAAHARFPSWQIWIRRLGLAAVVLLTIARLIFMAPQAWLPFPKPLDHEPWTWRMADIAKNRPVIIENSYRLPSLYRFYTGRPAWTITDVEYRRNQYDLWSGDSLYHGREVMMMGQHTWERPGATPFRTVKSDMLLEPISDFQVAKGVRAALDVALPDTLVQGQVYRRVLRLWLDPASSVTEVDFQAGLPLSPVLMIAGPGGEFEYRKVARPRGADLLKKGAVLDIPVQLRLTSPEFLGDVQLLYSIAYEGMPPLAGVGQPVALTVAKANQ